MTDVLFRLWIYESLGQLFDGTLDPLPEPPAAPSSSPGLTSAASAVRAAVAEAVPDDFRADHARLFVNDRQGVAAPPYASWYLDRQLLGPSSRWVDQAYAEQGLERAPDAGEPSDYVGAELEFLFFLSRHELAARHTADTGALRTILDGEQTFVLDHAARWLPAFIARIRQAKPGAVFAAAADLLGAVLQEDIRRLSTDDSKPMASPAHG